MDPNTHLSNVLLQLQPSSWTSSYDELNGETNNLQVISQGSTLYRSIAGKLSSVLFYNTIQQIVSIENHHLYSQFLMKKEEYYKLYDKSSVIVKELYHDTAQSNVNSIGKYNLDYRRVNRGKYGDGVSFSPCVTYANKQSARSNGMMRAMLVCDVLTHNCEMIPFRHVTITQKLPSSDVYDTVRSTNGHVYVKFYDNEFYPKYAIYYIH